MCLDKQCADCFLVRDTHENVRGPMGKPAAAHFGHLVACPTTTTNGKEDHCTRMGDAEKTRAEAEAAASG